MSVVDQVMEQAGTGATVPGIARRLQIPVDLAAAVVDELVRLGRLDHPPTGCTGCPPADAELPIRCAGCPIVGLAPRRRPL